MSQTVKILDLANGLSVLLTALEKSAADLLAIQEVEDQPLVKGLKVAAKTFKETVLTPEDEKRISDLETLINDAEKKINADADAKREEIKNSAQGKDEEFEDYVNRVSLAFSDLRKQTADLKLAASPAEKAELATLKDKKASTAHAAFLSALGYTAPTVIAVGDKANTVKGSGNVDRPSGLWVHAPIKSTTIRVIHDHTSGGWFLSPAVSVWFMCGMLKTTSHTTANGFTWDLINEYNTSKLPEGKEKCEKAFEKAVVIKANGNMKKGLGMGVDHSYQTAVIPDDFRAWHDKWIKETATPATPTDKLKK